MHKLCKALGIGAAALVMSGAAHAGSALDRLRDASEITIGNRESSIPFSYTGPAGTPIGFSIDLCREIVADIAAAQGVALPQINFVPVTSENRIILVQNGTVDLECGSTSNTAERQKQVAFSLNFFVTAIKMMVRTDSGLASFADLDGKVIVSYTGSSSDSAIHQTARAGGFQPRISYAKDNADAFLYITTGRGHAFINDDILLAGMIASARDSKAFAIVGEALRTEPYAIMMSRDDPALKDAVDAALRNIFADGRFATIYTNWFEKPIPPRNVNFNFPMSDSLKEIVAEPNDRAEELLSGRHFGRPPAIARRG
jgi:glutamate/aspartate transport system substrate-binding protein